MLHKPCHGDRVSRMGLITCGYLALPGLIAGPLRAISQNELDNNCSECANLGIDLRESGPASYSCLQVMQSYSRQGDRDRNLGGYLADGIQGYHYGLRRILVAGVWHFRRVVECPLPRLASIAFGVQQYRWFPSCNNREEDCADMERLEMRPALNCYCPRCTMRLDDILCHSV